jgi:N-acetylmuramoyl-L-alanine amidase
MEAVSELCHEILARHPIPARNVVGHSDIAPLRKQDPGELFDWRGLAEQGIGLWPPEAGEAARAEHAPRLLKRYGYDLEAGQMLAKKACIEAFQRHFRPQIVDGALDSGTLLALGRLVASLSD